MIVPMRSATTKRNSRLQRRHEHDQHGELTELDADVERQQRRQQVRAGELQRLRSANEKPKPCTSPNANAIIHRLSRDQLNAVAGPRPSLACGDDDVLERHVDDRDGDQRFDERRKPERVGRQVRGRRDERDRVRDRERRDDEDERPRRAERNDEAEQEQQVIGAVEDVLEAEPDEAPAPPDASADRAGRGRDRR